MPYHIAATPTPRRRGPPSRRAALNAAASARSAAQRGPQRIEAGRQPALAASSWPVAVAVAGAERVAPADLERVEAELLGEVVHQRLVGDRRLRHAEAAERAGRRPVRVDGARRARARAATAYGPIAWTGTRLATVGPHEA